ncbi:acetyltransferase [Aliiglaciecola lipolytica]|uniref:Lipid carrier: UDP-N-acetylgalactosaminyltransferase n=1 Tax=Aliiglaciecola lipolytica E3 TaxID=1127673 RepID=K6YX57_9ALTE|nr:acetyltransferase [Aliiglaciecola lipolytica]GAC15800.1 lipid carrier : UDP-N-acetylgalactosaminyltransferase [Aliiglaciecola lipolytica E3]
MQLLIIGAGGHGKVAAEIAELSGKYQKIQFIDDIYPAIQQVGPWHVVGTIESLSQFLADDVEVFVAIGGNATRRKVSHQVTTEYAARIATLIHPTAVISEHASVGEGCLVAAGAIINVMSQIGNGCIVNTAASIDHDCEIGEFAHISVGARLAGTVQVGELSFICINATISNNLKIGVNTTVGAGAVVIRNVEDNKMVVGIPAQPK